MKVRVTQTGAVSVDYYFVVHVPDGLSDEEAKQAAIALIDSGEGPDPYDSRAGDSLDGYKPDYEAEVKR